MANYETWEEFGERKKKEKELQAFYYFRNMKRKADKKLERKKVRQADRLNRSARRRGYKSYSHYLHSSHWQGFRVRYREFGRPQYCIKCGAKEFVLHHLSYKRMGREKLDDVIALCPDCHAWEHGKFKDSFDKSPPHIELNLEF
jgi:hypothetical protein